MNIISEKIISISKNMWLMLGLLIYTAFIDRLIATNGVSIFEIALYIVMFLSIFFTLKKTKSHFGRTLFFLFIISLMGLTLFLNEFFWEIRCINFAVDIFELFGVISCL